MRSTQYVVETEEGSGLGHYSDPPLLVLASLANGPKHGHAMIEDIVRMWGHAWGRGRCMGRLRDWNIRAGSRLCRRRSDAGRIELPRRACAFYEHD